MINSKFFACFLFSIFLAGCEQHKSELPEAWEVVIHKDKFDDSKKTSCYVKLNSNDHKIILSYRPDDDSISMLAYLPDENIAVLRDAQNKSKQQCVKYQISESDCIQTNKNEYANAKLQLRVDKGSIISASTSWATTYIGLNSATESAFFKEVLSGSLLYYKGTAEYGFEGDRILSNTFEGEFSVANIGLAVAALKNECKAHLP